MCQPPGHELAAESSSSRTRLLRVSRVSRVTDLEDGNQSPRCVAVSCGAISRDTVPPKTPPRSYPRLRPIALFLWDLIRCAVCLHLVWIGGWLVIVCINGGASPRCGHGCTVSSRVQEGLPWQTTDALFFYLCAYAVMLFCSYYCAASRWLRGRQSLGVRAAKLTAILLITPAFLNHAFWRLIIQGYGNVSYPDWNPAHAFRHGRPDTLPLSNGTSVRVHPSDVVLVGNGPLSIAQRALVRTTNPLQLYRFNGMTNLLPDEPVGHLFVRRVIDFATSGAREFPGDYWGLAPPLRRRGVLEWLYVPASSVVRERTMCHRAQEAVGVTLLNGSPDDAVFYARRYGVPMQLPGCRGLGREAPPTSGGAKAAGGWTSGVLGLLEVLEVRPHARIHLVGMNFGATPNQQHATHVERRLVQALGKSGRVFIHRPPAAQYHMEFVGNSADGRHLTFPTNLFLRDARIQGMRCGEWNVWWFPEWQWSPQRWYKGVFPLPPYFHPGTELHFDAEDSPGAANANYDPLNCSQAPAVRSGGSGSGRGGEARGALPRRLAEMHARQHSAQGKADAQAMALSAGGERLSVITMLNGRRLWMRRQLRRLKMRPGAGLYGGPLAANASFDDESREDCEQRVALIRRYQGLLGVGGQRARAGEEDEDVVAARVLRRFAEDLRARGKAYPRNWFHEDGSWRGIYDSMGTRARKSRDYIPTPLINTTQFHRDGYVIVDDVFPHELIDYWRQRILHLQSNESMQFKPWYVPSAADPGVTIPNFMMRPSFSFLHDLASSPPVLRVLRAVFGGGRFRYCSLNDIGIDRIVGWHKDVLNDQYKKYQTLPLWQKNPPEGGHFIVKVNIYLQDHTDDEGGLVLVPGSHRSPGLSTDGSITLHPKKGSLVIFEQRMTHRGRHWTPSRLLHNEPSRILLSLSYGRYNTFTDEFERGTRQRQADQCGSACAREERRKANERGSPRSGISYTRRLHLHDRT